METRKIKTEALHEESFDTIDYDKLVNSALEYVQRIGRKYPKCGFGGHFIKWIFSDNPQPCNSYDKGATMCVSAAGHAGGTELDALEIASRVTKASYDHRESVKAVEAVILAIYMGKNGLSKSAILSRINADYYSLDFSLDKIK